jgi:hypothetical protein
MVLSTSSPGPKFKNAKFSVVESVELPFRSRLPPLKFTVAALPMRS